jgi:hypothetical protein
MNITEMKPVMAQRAIKNLTSESFSASRFDAQKLNFKIKTSVNPATDLGNCLTGS